MPDISSNGFIARTASQTAAARTHTAANNKITIANGDGVSGNPTYTINEANFVSTPTGLTEKTQPALFAERVATVTNHAALEAIVPTSGAPTFYCTGHTSAGDGGEGLWRWVAGNSDTANGGTILGSNAAGRWKRSFSGPVSVQWFGAKCDSNGTDSNGTDDVAAFQAAATYAASIGAWLTIPGGICRVVLTGLYSGPTGLKLTGPGELFLDNTQQYRLGKYSHYKDLVVRCNASRTTVFHLLNGITTIDDEYVTLDGIKVTPNGSTYLNLAYIEAVNYITIRNCECINGQSGTSLTGNNILLRSVEHALIENNKLGANQYGVYCQGVRNSRIINNKITTARAAIIFTVYGSYTGANRWRGYLNERNIVSGNQIRDVYEESISADYPSGSATSTGQNGVLPVGNISSVTETSSNILTVKFTETGGGSPYAADFANGEYMCVQTGNAAGTLFKIIDSGDDGTNAWVTIANQGERLEAGLASGIVWIGVGAFFNTITGNNIYTDNWKSGVDSTGISLWGACWQNIITSNVIQSGDRAIQVSGLASSSPDTYCPAARNIIASNQISVDWVNTNQTEVVEGLTGAGIIQIGRYDYANEPDIGRATHHNIVIGNQINGCGGLRIERSDWDLIDGNCCAGTAVAIELKSAGNVQIGHNICVDGLVVAANIDDVDTNSTYTLLSH